MRKPVLRFAKTMKPWKITINSPMGAQEVEAAITTSGDTFTGSTKGRMGERSEALRQALVNHDIKHEYYVGGHGGHHRVGPVGG